MSIDATVHAVLFNENDSGGRLALAGPDRGQNLLHFDAAPQDVTALNGRYVWGGDSSLLYGEVEIAKRVGYGKIVFSVESVSKAIAEADRIRETRERESRSL